MITFMLTWILVFVGTSFVSIILLKLIKIRNLGLGLALGYFITVIFAVITVYKVHVDESGWYFMGVFILGMPTDIFTRILFNDFFDGLFSGIGFSNGGPLAEGIGCAIGGCVQYYLIGFLIQKSLRKSKYFSKPNNN